MLKYDITTKSDIIYVVISYYNITMIVMLKYDITTQSDIIYVVLTYFNIIWYNVKICYYT